MTQRMGNQSNNVCGDVLGPIEVITHEMESYVAEEIGSQDMLRGSQWGIGWIYQREEGDGKLWVYSGVDGT